MSELPGKPNVIPNKVVDLLVSDIFQKNNVNVEKVKSKLSDEQKQALKELVEDLTSQVNAFVNKQSPSEKDKK